MSTTALEKTGRHRGVAGVAALLGVAVLFGLIGLRVKETLGERKALAASLAGQTEGGTKRASATVVHGTPRVWRPAIPVTGTLAPVQEAEIGFKTGGKLLTVRVKAGDIVRRGQELGALDVSEASAQAAATSAGVRAAQVGYDMARDAEKRTLALFEQHAVSDAENLAAQNRAALSLAQLEQARAQARLATVGVGNGSLAAPFGGLVTRVPLGVGKIVAPGEAVFRLEDTSILKLTATLSEGDARLVQVGADVSVEGPSGLVPGKVTAILGSLDPQTRRVPLHAELRNDGASSLLAGAFVRATVVSSTSVPVLELPAGTLRPGSQDEVVLMNAGKAHIVRVVFTQGEGGALLVRSGVVANDAVVLNPSSEVREGEELTGARPDDAPGAAPGAPSDTPKPRAASTP